MAKIKPECVKIRTELLEPIAKFMKRDWFEQDVAKRACAIWWLNKLGVKDKDKFDALMIEWNSLPKSFGANYSQLAQEAGRPTREQVINQGSMSEFMIKPTEEPKK